MNKYTNLEINQLQDKEIGDLESILGQSLHFPDTLLKFWMTNIGTHNFRVAKVNGRVAGGIGIVKMNQWFGGAKVPMAGISMVGTAPEHRNFLCQM